MKKEEKYYTLYLDNKFNKITQVICDSPISLNGIGRSYSTESPEKNGFYTVVKESKIEAGKRKLVLYALNEAKRVYRLEEKKINKLRKLYFKM